MGSEYDSLASRTEAECRVKFQEKSNQELNAIIRASSAFIQSQSNMSAEMAVKAGEMRACSNILERRKQMLESQQKCINEAFRQWEEWEEKYECKRGEMFLRLQASAGYHGQLVTAVLETEASMTAEEISRWSDELSAMDKDAFSGLLDAMVKERTIRRLPDDKYCLYMLCTATLMPEDPIEWARQNLRANLYKYKRYLADQQLFEQILQLFVEGGIPVARCMDDILAKFATKQLWEQDERRDKAKLIVHELESFGILEKYKESGWTVELYGFPVLGW